MKLDHYYTQTIKPLLLRSVKETIAALRDIKTITFMHDVCAVCLGVNVAALATLRHLSDFLPSHFIVNHMIAHALLSGAFFVWFKTPQVSWEKFSWRAIGVLAALIGFASLIMLPITTLVNRETVEIPASFVLCCWFFAVFFSCFSRLFYYAVRDAQEPKP